MAKPNRQRAQLRKLANFLNRSGKNELRDEIKELLQPILSPPDPTQELAWITPPPGHRQATKKELQTAAADYSKSHRYETRRSGIDLLLAKLNACDLDRRYPIKDSSRNDDGKIQTMKSSPRGKFLRSRLVETELAFPDGQRITIQRFLGGTEREYYLSILREAIDTREFTRLRVCEEEECRKFFVADHMSKVYDNPACQRQHDRKAAVARADAWRANHPYMTRDR